MTAPESIDGYLAALPAPQSETLGRLRTVIVDAVPGAQEAIRTRVPAIRCHGKTVVGFGAAKSHLALYVMFGEALTILRDDLSNYETTRRVVRFTAAEPLPEGLVRKIVAVRMTEIGAELRKPKGGPGGAA